MKKFFIGFLTILTFFCLNLIKKETLADYYPQDGICMEKKFSLIGKVKPSYYSEKNLRFPFQHSAWEYDFATNWVKPTPKAEFSGSEFIMQLSSKMENIFAGENPTGYVLEVGPQNYFVFKTYKVCYWATQCSNPPKPMILNVSDRSYYTYYDSNTLPVNTAALLTPTPGKSPFAYVEYEVAPKLPNCKNISCSVAGVEINTVLVGDDIPCNVEFEKDPDTGTKFFWGRLFVNLKQQQTCQTTSTTPEQKTCSPPCDNTSQVFTINFEHQGTYYLHCSASSPPDASGNSFHCIGQASNPESITQRECVDQFVPPCRGPNASKTLLAVLPGPWYKLKDASLYKLGDHNIAVVQNIKKFTDSDTDDTTQRATIINSPLSDPGVLLSEKNYNPGPVYNPIPDSNKKWHLGSYGEFNQLMIDAFYQYAISRKTLKEINEVNEIKKDGIYVIKKDNLTFVSQPPSYNFLLIVRNSSNNDYGNVSINIADFNTSGKSIAILAKNITFSSNVSAANGIFIAQNQASYQSTNGLKIKGNLISKTQVSLQSRSDNSRPSLFIVFLPKMYLDLLPYLSIAKYDWRQLK